MNPVIKVQNLSKRYRLGLKDKQSDTLVGQITQVVRSPLDNLKRLRQLNRFGEEDESVFWALKDINFEVKEGEVLGIIGKNGAGKSTLLKILSGITDPTKGKIEINGRVASLLEVGTGFHPELSGRENIYMNGTILGMTKKEIDSKLDEIIEFSGVEKFIDTPVKFYSSGMKVRLGFSVAAHLDPEILIIDEVLAVGDFEFQKKCLGKMEDVSKNHGRTVLFVSHNMQAIRALCPNTLFLDSGKILELGETNYTLSRYLKNDDSQIFHKWTRSDINKFSTLVDIEQVVIELQGTQPNLKLKVEVGLCSKQFHKNLFIAFDVHSDSDEIIFQSIPQEEPFIAFKEFIQNFNFEIDLPPLIPGRYFLSVWIGTHYSQTLDWKLNVVSFEVNHPPTFGRVHPYSRDKGFFISKSKIIS